MSLNVLLILEKKGVVSVILKLCNALAMMYDIKSFMILFWKEISENYGFK